MGRTASFQFIRIILILGIVCSHCGLDIIGPGSRCVPFFFILSGFLFKEKPLKEYKSYVKRKIGKLFPFYYFCLLLSIVINRIPISIKILPHLFLLQSWIPTTTRMFFGYVGTAWFLSSLLFCYLVFPLIISYVNKLGSGLLFFLNFFLILFFRFDYGAFDTWVTYINPVLCLLEFTIGYFLKKSLERFDVKYVSFKICLLAIFIYIMCLHFVEDDFTVFIIHMLIIAFFYCNKNSLYEYIFAHKIILSSASYLIYIFLIHQILVRYFQELNMDRFLIIFYVLVICVGFCFCTYLMKSIIKSVKKSKVL